MTRATNHIETHVRFLSYIRTWAERALFDWADFTQAFYLVHVPESWKSAGGHKSPSVTTDKVHTQIQMFP